MDIFLNPLTQQWQQEKLELRQELVLICQYLSSLAERQEAQWHAIHYNHIQIMNENRQHFQFLSSILINITKPQESSTHNFCAQDNQPKKDVKLSVPDDNMSAAFNTSSTLGISFKEDADTQRIFCIGSPSIISGDHVTTSSMRSTEEQDRVTPENHGKEQKSQYYQRKGLDDPDHSWQTCEQQHLNNQIETLKISNQQQETKDPNQKLLKTGWNEEHYGNEKYTDTKINVIISEQNVTQPWVGGQKDELKDETGILDEQNDRKGKGRPRLVSQTEKTFVNTEKTQEEVKTTLQKPLLKNYADVVSTSPTLPGKLKMNWSLAETHTPDKLKPQVDTSYIPETQESFEGTGIIAEAISKLCRDSTPFSENSVKSTVSSNSQTHFRGGTRKDSSQHKITNSKIYASTPSSTNKVKGRFQ